MGGDQPTWELDGVPGKNTEYCAGINMDIVVGEEGILMA